MIITQKYHSANEIDPEFIPGIESLLRSEIPSFEWIKNYEKYAPENVHFNYYLFFGQKHNAPIGYAQVAIGPKENLKKKNKILSFFSKKTSGNKQAKWITPGVFGSGFIFEPLYQSPAQIKALALISDFFKRDDIAQLDISSDREIPLELNQKCKKNEKQRACDLLKITTSYEKYLGHLDKKIQDQISIEWKKIFSTLKYKIGEYSHFKEVFQYRETGKEQYKELKKNKDLKPFITDKTLYLTFEDEQQIFALVFLVPGNFGNLFFSWIQIDEKLDPLILSQLAIMKFYELEEFDRLHSIGKNVEINSLQNVGFEIRIQFNQSYNKDS